MLTTFDIFAVMRFLSVKNRTNIFQRQNDIWNNINAMQTNRYNSLENGIPLAARTFPYDTVMFGTKQPVLEEKILYKKTI